MSGEKPWANPMPEEQFAFMRDVLGAPSPVGFEGAMTFGVLKPYFEKLALEDDYFVERKRGRLSKRDRR